VNCCFLFYALQIKGNNSEAGKSSVEGLYPDTPVQYVEQTVGYGDDRGLSKTVDMLRKLTNSYGPISRFSGVAYADRIVLIR